MPISPLVSAGWLAQRLHTSHVKVVDASWYMPAAKRDTKGEFAQCHIPTAVFFDIDAHSDHSTDLPHMLPTSEQFSAAVGALGIGNEDTVIVYDTAGLFSAARVWWMFRYFGHESVAVLDGGFPQWLRENHPVAEGEANPTPTRFSTRPQLQYVRDKQALLSNIKDKTSHVLDARSAERFAGTAAEPRAGLRCGHIPGSDSLPFTVCLNEDGMLKSPTALKQLLTSAGVSYERPVVSSCGSGVTACVLDLALEITGHTNHAVYDGAWAEWGADASLPIATGMASAA